MTAGLRSMTGFGSARIEAKVGDQDLPLEVEVRSVNHRHLKINARVPESLTGLIPRLEELIREHVKRGTVYLHVRQGSAAGRSAWVLDRELLVRLHTELGDVAREMGIDAPDLGEVARMPGVVREEELLPEAEAIWPPLSQASRQALSALDAMRAKEGEGIRADLIRVVTEMSGLADQVQAAVPAAVEHQAQRLRGRIEQLLQDSVALEPGSLQREVALLAEKSDISEELQRLRSHTQQIEDVLHSPPAGPIGRKLEFIAQELIREANTMGNKSHDSELIERILSIKLCVERIREQLANVE